MDHRLLTPLLKVKLRTSFQRHQLQKNPGENAGCVVFPKKGKFVERKLEFKADGNLQMDQALATTTLNSALASNDGNACQDFRSCSAVREQSKDDLFLRFSGGEEYFANSHTGNFPSPKELANLGESFLANRCKLGYTASRILKLIQAIVEGKIRLRQLEELSEDASLSNQNQLAEQLTEI